MRVRVVVCVCPRGHKLLVAEFIIVAVFQFRFMAPAIDVIDRRDPSNEKRGQLQPKKAKVRLY